MQANIDSEMSEMTFRWGALWGAMLYSPGELHPPQAGSRGTMLACAASHPILPRLRPGHSLRRTPKLYPQSALGLKVKRWVVVSDGSGVFLRIVALGPGSRYAEFSASAISSSVMDRLGEGVVSFALRF
jgi:hypothetical protein